MSAGLVAHRRVLALTEMEDTPADSCCFSLTLRSGTILIGIGNFILYLCMFAWFLTSSRIDTGGLHNGLDATSLDIIIFSIFFVQILVNIFLVVGSVKRIPSLILPWLHANAASMIIAMNCSGYVTSLTTQGMVTGINLLCCIVVFTFRKNLLKEAHMERFPSGTDELSGVNNQCSSSLMLNLPPPSYNEIAGYKECKAPPEDAPPEYEEAVSMLSSELSDKSVKCPVLRKKSLTNNTV